MTISIAIEDDVVLMAAAKRVCIVQSAVRLERLQNPFATFRRLARERRTAPQRTIPGRSKKAAISQGGAATLPFAAHYMRCVVLAKAEILQ